MQAKVLGVLDVITQKTLVVKNISTHKVLSISLVELEVDVESEHHIVANVEHLYNDTKRNQVCIAERLLRKRFVRSVYVNMLTNITITVHYEDDAMIEWWHNHDNCTKIYWEYLL